jgi:uncharacterized protein YegL
MSTRNDQPSYLIENPNQRTPCLLVLDASASMTEKTSKGTTRIDELNRGLAALEQELHADPTARTRVQLAVVCVGGPAGNDQADVMLDWTDASAFRAFELTADANTPLAKGLMVALRLIEEQKQAYRSHGINYTRPWVMVITDGAPTDSDADWQAAALACRAAEGARKCVIYPVGVEGVNAAKLQEISTTQVLLLDQVKFVELFRWLSASLSTTSRSAQGTTVQLPSTDAWSSVKL